MIQTPYSIPIYFSFYGPGDPNQYQDYAYGRLTSLTAVSIPTVYTPQYAITDLGTLGGDTSSGSGINASGKVTGEADDNFGRTYAFTYSGNQMSSLGGLTGGTFSQGYGINDAGQVTGLANTALYADHAFRYSSGVMTYLGTLGGSASEGLAINASGQVAGDAQTSSNETHAFLYSSGVMTDLGTLGGTYSVGYGLNKTGQVAGTATIPYNNAAYPVLYSNGTMTNLGTLGGSGGQGYGVNDFGQVVGKSDTGLLDTSGNGFSHAFLYKQGHQFDLNTLISSEAGWTLSAANAINNQGSITGYGQHHGYQHAYLLTPLSAPDPIVVSLSPSSKVTGSSAFILTVNGTGFAANSLVKWNGMTQTTTYVSSTVLTATVPASLLTALGTAQVTVTTPHIATSSALAFPITAPTHRWTATGIAAGTGGTLNLLWDSTSGSASIWTINGSAIIYSPTYGAFAGWDAKSIADAPDACCGTTWTAPRPSGPSRQAAQSPTRPRLARTPAGAQRESPCPPTVSPICCGPTPTARRPIGISRQTAQ